MLRVNLDNSLSYFPLSTRDKWNVSLKGLKKQSEYRANILKWEISDSCRFGLVWTQCIHVLVIWMFFLEVQFPFSVRASISFFQSRLSFISPYNICHYFPTYFLATQLTQCEQNYRSGRPYSWFLRQIDEHIIFKSV